MSRDRTSAEIETPIQPAKMVAMAAGDGLYAAFFRDAPDAVVAVDRDGRIVDANDQVTILFGYEPGELIGEPVERLVPERLASRHGDVRARYLTTPERRPMGVGLELWARRKDGTELPVDVSLSPVRGDGPVVTLAAVRDVSARRRAELQLRQWAEIFEHAQWGVVVGSADGTTLQSMNSAFARMHGYTVEELLGRPLLDVFAPEVRAAATDHLARLNENGHHAFESLHLRKDGSVFPVAIDASAIRDDRGQVVYCAANVVDISEAKRAEQALQASERRFRTVFEHAPLGMAIVDHELRFEQANDALCRMLDCGPAELATRRFADLTPPEDVRRDEELARRLFAGELDRFSIEKRYLTAGGRVLWANLTMSALGAISGSSPQALAMVEDITARKQTEMHLAHRATHDELTGLANRAALNDRLDHAIARQHRTGQYLAVLFADLDGFKTINDAFGHPAGDTVLRDVAHRIHDALRPADLAARVGGDEFVAVCEDLGTDRTAAEPTAQAIAERVIEAVHQPTVVGRAEMQIDVSVGIVVVCDTTRAPYDLIAAADTAMYDAKSRTPGSYAMASQPG